MLGIGPLNTASQATAWASVVRTMPAFSIGTGGAMSRAIRGSRLVQPADYHLPHYRLSPEWARRNSLARLRRRMTHLLNESNAPLGVDPRRQSFVDQLAGWDDRLSAAVVFHGSDARDPARSIVEMPHSYFREVPTEWLELQGAKAARNRSQVRDAGLPTFVTTPDLLSHVEGAVLLPLSVNTDRWEMPVATMQRRRLRVLHQPSQRDPDVKGTRFIDPVLREMHDEGLIEYVHRGVVSASQMRELISKVDIVVDQLLAGAYGVTAVEALAAGRVVVASVGGSCLRAFGEDLPVVNSNPATFREVMRDLVNAAPEELEQRAHDSRAHALRWHNGAAAALALGAFLDDRDSMAV